MSLTPDSDPQKANRLSGDNDDDSAENSNAPREDRLDQNSVDIGHKLYQAVINCTCSPDQGQRNANHHAVNLVFSPLSDEESTLEARLTSIKAIGNAVQNLREDEFVVAEQLWELMNSSALFLRNLVCFESELSSSKIETSVTIADLLIRLDSDRKYLFLANGILNRDGDLDHLSRTATVADMFETIHLLLRGTGATLQEMPEGFQLLISRNLVELASFVKQLIQSELPLDDLTQQAIYSISQCCEYFADSSWDIPLHNLFVVLEELKRQEDLVVSESDDFGSGSFQIDCSDPDLFSAQSFGENLIDSSEFSNRPMELTEGWRDENDRGKNLDEYEGFEEDYDSSYVVLRALVKCQDSSRRISLWNDVLTGSVVNEPYYHLGLAGLMRADSEQAQRKVDDLIVDAVGLSERGHRDFPSYILISLVNAVVLNGLEAEFPGVVAEAVKLCSQKNQDIRCTISEILDSIDRESHALNNIWTYRCPEIKDFYERLYISFGLVERS